MRLMSLSTPLSTLAITCICRYEWDVAGDEGSECPSGGKPAPACLLHAGTASDTRQALRGPYKYSHSAAYAYALLRAMQLKERRHSCTSARVVRRNLTHTHTHTHAADSFILTLLKGA